MIKIEVNEEELKEYMFNLLIENKYDVREPIDFGKTTKENQYCLVCTTDDEDNDLICWFDAIKKDDITKITNIKVF